MVPAVDVRDVSKRFRVYHTRFSGLKERLVRFGRTDYEMFWAVRNVSFHLRFGETLGLIGANGQGKSTLLQVIGGIIRPTEGSVTTRGRVAILLEVGAGFHPDLTGRENIYMNGSILGLTKKQIDERFDDIVHFAELENFIDNQIKHFSSGMYVRLGFSIAVHADPQILLVDEVLAVGDEAFQQKCLRRISEFQTVGKAILFVSHDLELVERTCDRVLLLENGRCVMQGAPRDVIAEYKRRITPQA